MKLVTFVPPNSLIGARIGAMVGEDRIADLAGAYAAVLRQDGLTEEAARRIAGASIPDGMTEFLETGSIGMSAARSALASVTEHDDAPILWRRDAVRLLSPVPRPPNLRDGNGFEAHARNASAQLGGTLSPAWYEQPAYYKGTRGSVAGPDDSLLWPEPSEQLDFEFEFAAVIGRSGKSIPAERALDHIAGYTLLNDFSARDFQAREMPMLMGPAKGKDFDGSTIMGPYLVTIDEVPDPYALHVTGRVNGEVVCEASTSDAYWRWPQLIEHISRNETLLPGDVIGSGTVGSGSLFERGGPFLKPGDVVELEITGLGSLRTELVRPT